MKLLKNYQAFFPRRIFYLRILLPIGILLLFIPCMPFLKTALYPLLYTCLLFVDGLLDFWLLGGIYERGNTNIEYLKTSNHGTELLQKVMVCDMLLRLFPTVVIPALAAGIELLQNQSGCPALTTYPANLLLTIISAYAMAVLDVFITRFTSSFLLSFSITSLYTITAAVLFTKLIEYGTWWMVFPAMICAIGLSILSCRLLARKIRLSYYDTQVTARNR